MKGELQIMNCEIRLTAIGKSEKEISDGKTTTPAEFMEPEG